MELYVFSVGALNVSVSYEPTEQEAMDAAGPVSNGCYKPTWCRPQQSVAIIIPYKNRLRHLITLMHHIHPILQVKLYCKIGQIIDMILIFCQEVVRRTVEVYYPVVLSPRWFVKYVTISNLNCQIQEVGRLSINDRNQIFRFELI